MSIIGLPSPGDEDWYDYATSLDTEARTIAAKETPAGAQAKADAAQAAAEATAAAALADVTATDVPFTPSGTLAATNVGGALVELDVEKTGSADVDTFVVLTEAAYTALGTKDARTVYLRTP